MKKTVFILSVILVFLLSSNVIAEDKTVLYALDGRQITVYVSEVSAYVNLGWYKTYEEVTAKLYAPDGRDITVYKSQVDSFKKVGWFDKREDVVTKMRSLDDRVIEVYNSQVDAFSAVGWYPVQKNTIDPSKPMVALTFDDGPNKAYTTRILNVLEKYNGRATFFVLGNLVRFNKDVVKRAKDMGCQIGNHSYSHPDLATLSYASVASQIQNTSAEIYSACGIYPTVVRPPYGSYTSSVASASGMPLVLWSVDTLDWKWRNADKVYSHILSNVRDGDVILMHDIYDSTASAAERVIPELIKKGYQLVTVEELFGYKGKTLNNGSSYSCAR